jgi:hypothetical protein
MGICAVILILFAVLVVLWNGSNIAWMVRRGGQITPLIATAPRGSGRIAAYQVETSPAGAYVRVRLEQPLVPGLLLFRDVATVDAPYIDGLTLLSPTSVCVSFSEGESYWAEPHRRVDALLQFGPLIRWTTPPQLSARSQSPSCSMGLITETGHSYGIDLYGRREIQLPSINQVSAVERFSTGSWMGKADEIDAFRGGVGRIGKEVLGIVGQSAEIGIRRPNTG